MKEKKIGSTMPKVSIIVPCYNSEQFIEQTLKCVSDIDYPNWECIVVNDGSTDSSQELIDNFCLNDKRFITYRQNNSGPSAARNYAISMCNGDYILPLDADDLITKDYISEAVEVFQLNPKLKLVYCNARKFGRKNCLWKLEEYSFKKLLLDNLIFCTALFRRSDFLQTRGYDVNLLSGREDWDFWIELLKTGGEVYKINKVHFFYRTHKNSHNRLANKNIEAIRKQVYENHKEQYEGFIDNPIQLTHEHAYFKKKYNLIRKLTFRKSIP